MQFDKEKRIFMVKKFHELKNSTLVQRAWRTEFKFLKAPTHKTISYWSETFNKHGTVENQPHDRPDLVKKREALKNQLESLFKENSSLSLRKAAVATGSSHSHVRVILVKVKNSTPQ